MCHRRRGAPGPAREPALERGLQEGDRVGGDLGRRDQDVLRRQPRGVHDAADAHRQPHPVKDKALADKIYAELKAGADFATLAKKYSTDPGSKSQGGQLTITRGQTVPTFDKTAFALATGSLSKPINTQFGWHIIHADKAAKPRQSTPFAQVKESIRQKLLQDKRNGTLQKWLDAMKKEYAGEDRVRQRARPRRDDHLGDHHRLSPA